MTRPKSFLTYFALCAIPLLLLAGLNYWNGIQTVDSAVSAAVQDDFNSFSVAVDEVIGEQEKAIMGLALNPDVKQQLVTGTSGDLQRQTSLLDLSKHFQSLTLFDRDRRALNGSHSQLPARPNTGTRSACLGTAGKHLTQQARRHSSLEYTTPIHDENGTTNIGAIVGVLDLKSVFATAARGIPNPAKTR